MTDTGTYVGPITALKGKRALVEHSSPDAAGDTLQAQFNFYPPEMNENNDGGPYNFICFGWHRFARSSFEIDPRGDLLG